MRKITLELTVAEAKFLSTILGHVMSFLLSFDISIQGSNIDKLKVKIQEELLKV